MGDIRRRQQTAETAADSRDSRRQQDLHKLVQVHEDIPAWAGHWVNVRKGFANFYRTTATRYTEHMLLIVYSTEYRCTLHSVHGTLV